MNEQNTFRQQREELESLILAPNAAFVKNTRGRQREQALCPVRTEYVRDRDRILHCKAFRRLKHKTQVFLAPMGDHYRTRLTHTLEVAQIARTVSRALRLNEDLTEAIALGHDLGHTPFGHAGEEVLNLLVAGGFSHNLQSLRVVDKLERDGEGLNLTYEVRDGIVNHKKDGLARTLEGRAVSVADRIAYLNHDIDDAGRAGILREEDIPLVYRDAFGHSQGERINNMVKRLLKNCLESGEMAFCAADAELFDALRDYMFKAVYRNPKAKSEESKAKNVVEKLYEHFLRYPDELPADYRNNIEADGLPRVVADHVSGMTDLYAIETYKRLYVPQNWR